MEADQAVLASALARVFVQQAAAQESTGKYQTSRLPHRELQLHRTQSEPAVPQELQRVQQTLLMLAIPAQTQRSIQRHLSQLLVARADRLQQALLLELVELGEQALRATQMAAQAAQMETRGRQPAAAAQVALMARAITVLALRQQTKQPMAGQAMREAAVLPERPPAELAATALNFSHLLHTVQAAAAQETLGLMSIQRRGAVELMVLVAVLLQYAA